MVLGERDNTACTMGYDVVDVARRGYFWWGRWCCCIFNLLAMEYQHAVASGMFAPLQLGGGLDSAVNFFFSRELPVLFRALFFN